MPIVAASAFYIGAMVFRHKMEANWVPHIPRNSLAEFFAPSKIFVLFVALDPFERTTAELAGQNIFILIITGRSYDEVNASESD